MTSFFAESEFVHTDNGVTCSDSGFRDLSTAQECSDAVNYATSFNTKAVYRTTVSTTNRPKGCYILGSGYMYFNTHPDGGRSSSVNSICWRGNM